MPPKGDVAEAEAGGAGAGGGSGSSGAARGKAFLEWLVSRGGGASFDAHALSGITGIHASDGRVTCSLMVDPHLTNRYGTLHGGLTATLVDVVGTAALVTRSEESGVSVEISVSYLSAMPGGEEVEIDARVLRVGRTLGTVVVDLRHKATGRLVAQGRHTKHLPGTIITRAKL